MSTPTSDSTSSPLAVEATTTTTTTTTNDTTTTAPSISAPSSSTTTAVSAPTAVPAGSVGKVKVHFVPVGSVPILKKTKFQIASDQRFASVHTFLRKVLKLQPGDSLFLYLSSSFCPGPEELLGDLNACFALQQRGELVIHYSFQQAWG
ncbi:ubiquitin-like autophagy protein [Nitzschia inconspicua]|uniref:Ubiquitin-like autophagy protein n=1 Tax=Nitzschia inconspicua TaxID=303405 RepID=A0A9K3M0L2_9STRA|nr:ubiquitin-like autophagy protein [Nitzschia inconspicua]KAG7371250.1 ubiquitin-like autophagy protein [Nitzschia inconspicua]